MLSRVNGGLLAFHLAIFRLRFLILVELSNKRSDDFSRGGVGKMRKEIGPVAVIDPLSDKENLNDSFVLHFRRPQLYQHR